MFSRVLTQVTHIKLPLFSRHNNTHWSVRTPTRPVHLLSSPARCPLSLPVTRFKLVAVSLNTFLIYSTLGFLLYNCCYLLLKQLRFVVIC
ncbi:unnamed protein product [Hymenolepis diminuta]|uniref:Uncharacterized protein n=1 Tax=Hymenolepis diminuta TaxID=6216 RepID=A0A564ZCP9_HYMDI|nr:unnamed protein product [Hymenolepis diminuta]